MGREGKKEKQWRGEKGEGDGPRGREKRKEEIRVLEGIRILVIFCGAAEIRKHDAIGIFNQIVNKESLHSVILVLQNKMNSYAQKVAEQFPVKVETFHIADLLVNITKHVLAPKHIILTSKEKNQLLKQHSVEDKQIPWMLVTDAVARYYGLEKGQVVKISHTGGLTDTVDSYRCVV